ncbi:MAG: hypothetical protein IT198_10920 [Acidimicrobiia bacterium]|nr:hypothetical protein [Acidimicrobiia bacterium]
MNTTRHSRLVPVILVAIPALAAVVGAIWIVLAVPHVFGHAGDQALLELMTRDALAGDVFTGVYSRFGWRHPGPSYIYLLAPGYLVTGRSAAGMYAATWVLNVGAIAAATWVTYRRVGTSVALATLILGGTLLMTQDDPFITSVAWNPSVAASFTFLLVVLVAVAWQGSWLALLGGVLVASFLIQAHVGTAPVAGSLLLVAAVGCTGMHVLARRRDRARSPDATVPDGAGPEDRPDHASPIRRRRRSIIGGGVIVGLVVLMWVPPLYDQFRGTGNLGEVAAFFIRGQEDSGRSYLASVDDVAWEYSRLPLGPHRWYGDLGELPASIPRRATTLALVGLGVAVVILGVRRRHGFAIGAGSVTVVGFLVSVVAVQRIIGSMFSYLGWWIGPLAAGAILGGVALAGTLRVFQRLQPWAKPAFGVACVVACVPFLVLAGRVAATERIEPAPDALPTAKELARFDGGGVLLIGSEKDSWMDMAALVLQLERIGEAPSVDPVWEVLFGSAREPGADTDTFVYVTRLGNDPYLADKRVRFVGSVGESAVYVVDDDVEGVTTSERPHD